LKRLDLGFEAFFRRVKGGETPGFPRFKALDRFSGWGYKTHGDGFRLLAGERMKHGRIRLSGIGTVVMRGQARTQGKPVTCEILRKAGKWYASVTLECQPERDCGTRALGLDWGVETFATLAYSDGTFEAIPNPRLLRKAQVKLKAAQRSLAKRKRRSRNRLKAKARVASLSEKVSNQRKNFLHQTSAALVKRAALIATEGLNIRGMTASAKGTIETPGKRVRQKSALNRSILDTAPATFLLMLKTKAEEAGCEFVETPTKELKPSQRCAKCGMVEKKPLSQRTHACLCGFRASRDENGALVNLIWALNRASGREPAGWGGAA
jgi:putative transposase